MQISSIDFYTNQLREAKENYKRLKSNLLLFSLIRLSVFLITGLAIYLLQSTPYVPLIIGLVGFGSFLFLVSHHANLKRKKIFQGNLIDINEKEIEFLESGKLSYANGVEFEEASHFYASDIDLFGEGSFYQLINRTSSIEGEKFLADILKENSIDDIFNKQESVKELSELAKWRQTYQAKVSLSGTSISQSAVVKWLANHQAIVPKIFYYLSIVFKVLSLIGIILYTFDVISYVPLIILFFTGLIISGVYIKKINHFSIHLSELKDVFASYSGPIQDIEEVEFDSIICKSIQSKIISSKSKASTKLKQFSGYLNALDQRNNILFVVLGNGFLLWDITQVYKIDTWLKENVKDIESWFNSISFFEAYNSLANYSFNHPNYVYPVLSDSKDGLIKAESLGHVLMSEKQRINNDFLIKDNNFKIITGANMAGKSTFLRTVSLSIVSANSGLPVCAKSYQYSPIKLVTSMRNTDSLQTDSSYFYSELVRLKMIVDAVDKEPYFIILDEILKGTNSKDKEMGSIQFVNRLSKSSSSGIIATHDLGLCEVEKSLNNIGNQYFDAEIKDNELYFDYTLKQGICQNMNASFLLKKMGIV